MKIWLGQDGEGSANSLYYKEEWDFFIKKQKRVSKPPNGFLMWKLCHMLLVTVNIYIYIFIYVY